ncbi:MAG: EamA family transporter [Candidatus Hadarchaeales archaeon]
MGIGAPLYKKCTERVGKISVEKFLRDPKGMISRLVFNLTFLAAVLFGFGGWVLWLSGLSGLEAMIGGPILAAMYITSLLVARFYLGERLTPREGMGLGILLLGILVLGFAGGAG